MIKKLFLISFLAMTALPGCGWDHETGSTGAGSIAFSIEWKGIPSTVSPATGASRAPLDCSVGVYQIMVSVVNSADNQVSIGGPWACSDHAGDITNVPAGSGYKVTVTATDFNGVIMAYGEKAGLNVVGNQTTDAGIIDVSFITTLAFGLIAPLPIALDSANVYWAEFYNSAESFFSSGTIKRVEKNGGVVTTLASNRVNPRGLAVDAANVYWAESNGIYKMVISGGTPTLLAGCGFGGCGFTLAADSTNVYWIGLGEAVKTVSINGGTPTTLASLLLTTSPDPNYGSTLNKIAVDATSVYWTENGLNGYVRKIGKNGTGSLTMASNLFGPTGLAVDSANVYWVQGNFLQKIPFGGGTVTALAPANGGGYGHNVATDSTSVYWIDQSGAIKKVGINGGAVTTLAPAIIGIYERSVGGNSIAVDSTSVYWTDGSNAIKKVAK